MKEYFEKIYKNSPDNFYNLIKNNLINNKKMFIVTANPETLMISEKNTKLKRALLDSETTIVADGIGIVKGGNYLNYKFEDTIPGIELCSKLLEYCNEFKKSIFLFGASETVIKKLINVINLKYKNIIIYGYENGYIKNKQAVFDKIINLQPDVVLVALGIPHQELLIYDNLNQFSKGIFVGVGGSFDVLSGIKKRAPKFFINLHLEWLYRILKEPKRFKRFFDNNLKYFFRLLNFKKEAKE